MKQEEFLQIAQKCGALLEGHFLLSSGLHSSRYFQCSRLLERPWVAEQLGEALAQRVAAVVDLVIAPAVGGILVAHEVARALAVRALFAEREPRSGGLTLRRGFQIHPGDKTLVVEDVVTTGGSLCETVDLVGRLGGRVVAAGALVDRGQGFESKLDVPFQALVRLALPTFEASACPMCREGSSPMKPGSRPAAEKGA